MLNVRLAATADLLAADLARRLVVPGTADVFEAEWIEVPNAGWKRWISLQLAGVVGAAEGGTDGVAANIGFVFPGALRMAVLRAAADDAQDPWRPAQLMWVVAEVLNRSPDTPIGPFVRRGSGGNLGPARRLAEMLDRCHLYRPEKVLAWATATTEPTEWQGRLWRAVRDHLGVASPPELLAAALPHVRSGELPVDLPARLNLVVVGPPTGGRNFWEVAAAVGSVRDVSVSLLLSPGAQLPRIDDELSAVWLREQRDTWAVLAEYQQRCGDVIIERLDPDRTASAEVPVGLLGALQQSLHSGRTAVLSRPEAQPSVELFACHGPVRQLEALRDRLLTLLAADESLSEDDIVVLCADPQRFAPAFAAVWGDPGRTVATDENSLPVLRYRVVEPRTSGTDSPVHVLAQVLEVIGGRFDRTKVLDLLLNPLIAQRWGITPELERLLSEANVRWGVDGEHRRDQGITPAYSMMSWQHGLDRLVMGAIIDDNGRELGVGQVVPQPTSIDDLVALGPVHHLVGSLARLRAFATESHPLAEWLHELRAFAEDACDLDAQPVGTAQLGALIAELSAAATVNGGAAAVPIDLFDLQGLWQPATGRGGSYAFAGGINVTSLRGLRGIPFPVVALVGFDQSAFTAALPGLDDLVGRTPQPGDPNPYDENGALLCDAVCSAGQQLLVFRDGADERTGRTVPPAVIADTMLDELRVLTADVGGFTEAHQPRVGGDRRHFTTDGSGGAALRSFDPLAAATVNARRRQPSRSSLVVGGLGTDVVQLADLHAFLKSPSKFFLERRLGLKLPKRLETADTQIPVSLSGLAAWRVREDGLTRLRDGIDGEWIDRAILAGTLPPETLGQNSGQEADTFLNAVRLILDDQGLLDGYASPPLVEPIDVELANGRRVVGEVSLVAGSPPRPLLVTASRPKINHSHQLWLDLLALARQSVTGIGDGLLVNRTAAGDKAESHTVALRDGGAALDELVELYDRACRQPLPWFGQVSELLLEGKDPDWEGQIPGRIPAAAQIEHRLLYGELATEALVSDPDIRAVAAAVKRMVDGSMEATP